MPRTSLSVPALALALGLAGGAFAGNALADESVTAWRLFVSDHEKPVVHVIDALDGDRLGTFTVDGPATLHRTGSGETVFAVQGAAGKVSAIATGIAFHDHGDHADIDVDEPKLLDTVFSGQKPAHFVERQGIVAQWFDGEKAARVFSEKAVLDGKAEVRTVDVTAAHHGVAVPYDNHAVVTIPNPEDASKRPVGARIVGFDGKQAGGDAACPGLHGSAGSGDIYALACGTGLLLITRKGDAPEIRHLPYAKSLPEGSVSTLIGGKGLQYFVGNFGADRIVLVDPSEAEAFRLVQLPTRRVHFVVDPVRPQYVYVFTEDGKLHRVDVVKGEIAGSLTLTGPYSMDGHWSDPRPRVAVAGDKVVVTDPLAGKLHVVDAGNFGKTGEIAVEGKPFNIVAVGGTGQVHDHAEGEGHAHAH
ncbi:MAG: zinc metallochaperone AztD [Pseudochelatococcus sp.]|uniref:zinc metallochaperone AztD n=1 Tax=Pseudochelatococcus sp. TaxID=2020869 RepID=UPI003D8C9986